MSQLSSSRRYLAWAADVGEAGRDAAGADGNLPSFMGCNELRRDAAGLGASGGTPPPRPQPTAQSPMSPPPAAPSTMHCSELRREASRLDAAAHAVRALASRVLEARLERTRRRPRLVVDNERGETAFRLGGIHSASTLLPSGQATDRGARDERGECRYARRSSALLGALPPPILIVPLAVLDVPPPAVLMAQSIVLQAPLMLLNENGALSAARLSSREWDSSRSD